MFTPRENRDLVLYVVLSVAIGCGLFFVAPPGGGPLAVAFTLILLPVPVVVAWFNRRRGGK